MKLIGYIIAFALMAAGLVAIVMFIIGLGNGSTTGNIITTMPPITSTTPDPDGNTTLSDTQQNGTNSVTVGTPTPVPTPTPTPGPSPTPTPAPTPTPPPVATPLGSGKFSSDTKLWIDLDAVWEAETIDNETAKVTVTANLRSYSLNTPAKLSSLDISVDEDYTSLDVQQIKVDRNEETVTELGTYSFTVDAPAGQISLIPLEVVWHYGGTYSGKPLETITVKGNIELSR